MGALPLFLPGMVLWTAVAILLSPPVGRYLCISRPHAVLLLVALGITLMATLPPTGNALAGGGSLQVSCDFGRTTLAPLSVLLRPNESSLNVLLFVPLGLALGSLPASRRSLAVVAAAFLLPLAIEAYQLVLPALGRGCQSADVIDNTMGLVIGLALGFSARWIFVRAQRTRTRA